MSVTQGQVQINLQSEVTKWNLLLYSAEIKWNESLYLAVGKIEWNE